MRLLLLSLTTVISCLSQATITGISKNVTTAGTPVALTSTRTLARYVTIQAKSTNTGSICVGSSSVSCSSLNGVVLNSGNSIAYFAQGEPKAVNSYDLSKIFINSTVNGEGVSIVYGLLPN